jgi:MFS family permease
VSRRLGILVAVSSAIALVVALAIAPSSGPDELERFRRAHRRTQLAGMGVLTGWALANIAGGVTGALVEDGDARFIHEMNALWNSVNLTLGIIGLVNNARRPPQVRTRADARRVNRKARRVYLINGAIDVAYMAAGALTAGLGRQYGQRRVEGWGTAVVIQGAWLFAFDLAMVLAHERVAARTLPVGVAPLAGAGRLGIAIGGRF